MQYLTEKYGSVAAKRKLEMAKFAAYSEDVVMDIEHMKRMPSSQLAHQAILALEHNFDPLALTQALFHGLFTHGKDISNPEVLKSIIEGIDLDGVHVMRSIQHKEIADHQKELTQYVHELDAHQIPYFIVDGCITDHTFIVHELRKPLKDAS